MKIAEAICIAVTPIVIWPFARLISGTMVSQAFSKAKVSEMAKRDGFENVKEFYKFFERYGSECLEDFESIEWDPDTVVRYAKR